MSALLIDLESHPQRVEQDGGPRPAPLPSWDPGSHMGCREGRAYYTGCSAGVCLVKCSSTFF